MMAYGFTCLKNEMFAAFIADNSALGLHHAGLNGVASLVPWQTGNNIFVPFSGGLNYEIVALAGLDASYPGATVSPFEPRNEPMRIDSVNTGGVTLFQPETSHSHIAARITFHCAEPYYLHQHIELTFHRRFMPEESKSQTFHSLFASYIHAPADRHVYLKHGEDGDLAGWIGLTKIDHGPADWLLHPLPEREISTAEHSEVMRNTPPEVFWYGPVPPRDPLTLGHEVQPGPLSFYYGLLPGDFVFLMMFKQPEHFRFAYSPCGGGTQPAWNPAWDYVLYLEDVELNRPYAWDLCLAVKPYVGRRDVLDEVRRYIPNYAVQSVK